jgi:hypothetical protein
MQLTNALVASAALAAGVSATLPHGKVTVVEAVVRNIHTYTKATRSVNRAASLFRRQSDECNSAASALEEAYNNDPMPSPDSDLTLGLATYLAENDVETPSAICPDQLPEITGTVGEALTSYADEVLSWWSAHTDELQDVYSACNDEMNLGESLSEIAMGCTSLLADITGSGNGGNGDSGDGSGAAPLQTGAVMAAMGVAGVVAAIL